jgi:hypothetical protein
VDFLRIVRSLEDLLYEVIAWLVFYPRTLGRILLRPSEMLRYSDTELTDTPDDQYVDTLSPPLFLMLTVLIAHGVELALGTSTATPKGTIGRMLLSSEQNLLLMRSLLFSIYALVGATTLLRLRRVPLDRKTMRGPFYAQCYLIAPFALGLYGAGIMERMPGVPIKVLGVILALVSIVWYLSVQTQWFKRQGSATTGRALRLALWCFVQAAAYNAVINGTLLTIQQ